MCVMIEEFFMVCQEFECVSSIEFDITSCRRATTKKKGKCKCP